MKALFEGKHIWWQRPRVRTDADEEIERKASWLELFFDLVFVAVLLELSAFLHPKHSFDGVLGFIFLFVPVWWMWNGITFYNERYEVNDVRHRVLTFLCMIPIAGMAYSITEAFEGKANTLAVSHIVSRGILSYMWLTTGASESEKTMSRIFAGGLWISIMLLIVSIFVEAPYKYILWGASAVVDLVTPLFTLSTQVKLPRISTSHLPERFGLLIILAIGETVIGTIEGLSVHPVLTLNVGLCVFLSLLVSFIIWWLYVDHVLYRVFRKGIWYTLAWCYIHLPLALCITAISTALNEVVSLAGTDSIVPVYQQWLLTGFIVGFLLMVALLGLVSESTDHHHKIIKFHKTVIQELFFVKLCSIMLIVIIVGFLGNKLTPLWLLVTTVVIMIISAVHGLNLWVKSNIMHQRNQPVTANSKEVITKV